MERLRRPALLSALALLAACANPSPGAPPSVPAAPAPGATAPEAADLSMRENSSRYVIVALANPLQRVPVRAATSPAGYGAPPRYTTGMHAATLVEQIAREHQLVQAAAWPIPSLNVHCIVFEILDSRPREEVLAALAKDDRIALAQPLQDFSVQEQPTARTADAAVAYNDPYAPLQRGFIGTSAAQAHRVTTGRGTHVAVIDTGAQTGHPDLQGRILETHNLVDDDAGAFQKDRHGTEVLGIMAATGNNLQGIVGMAPAARFSLYKACWYPAQPPGSGARCNSFTLAKALVAVMSSDARIVNMSLGGPSDPPSRAVALPTRRPGPDHRRRRTCGRPARRFPRRRARRARRGFRRGTAHAFPRRRTARPRHGHPHPPAAGTIRLRLGILHGRCPRERHGGAAPVGGAPPRQGHRRDCCCAAKTRTAPSPPW